MTAAAQRSDPALFDRDPPQPDHPVLLHAPWPGDDEARVLARRNQWNDGLDHDGRYVDHVGRACGTTEASFEAWWSRLTPEDRQDPGIAGFADFVRARQADRAARAAETEDRRRRRGPDPRMGPSLAQHASGPVIPL